MRLTILTLISLLPWLMFAQNHTTDTSYGSGLLLFHNSTGNPIYNFKFKMTPLRVDHFTPDTVYHNQTGDISDVRAKYEVITAIDTHDLVSISELEERGYRIYPNPGHQFRVDLPLTVDEITLQIRNSNGQFIKTTKVRSGEIVDLKDYASGYYYISLTKNETPLATVKYYVSNPFFVNSANQPILNGESIKTRKKVEHSCTYGVQWNPQQGFKGGYLEVTINTGTNKQINIKVQSIDTTYLKIFLYTDYPGGSAPSDKIVVELDSENNVIDTLFHSIEVDHVIWNSFVIIDSIQGDTLEKITRKVALIIPENDYAYPYNSIKPAYGGFYGMNDTFYIHSDQNKYILKRYILDAKPPPAWVGHQQVKGRCIDTDGNPVLEAWIYLYDDSKTIIDSAQTYNNKQGYYEFSSRVDSEKSYYISAGSKDSTWSYLSYAKDAFTARRATLGNQDSVFFANYTFIPKIGKAPMNGQLDTLTGEEVRDAQVGANIADAIQGDTTNVYIDVKFSTTERADIMTYLASAEQKFDRKYKIFSNPFTFSNVGNPYDTANYDNFGINILRGGSNTTRGSMNFTDATGTHSVLIGANAWVGVSDQEIFDKEVEGRSKGARGIPNAIRASYMNPAPKAVTTKDSHVRTEIQKVEKNKYQLENTANDFFQNTNHTFSLDNLVDYIGQEYW